MQALDNREEELCFAIKKNLVDMSSHIEEYNGCYRAFKNQIEKLGKESHYEEEKENSKNVESTKTNDVEKNKEDDVVFRRVSDMLGKSENKELQSVSQREEMREPKHEGHQNTENDDNPQVLRRLRWKDNRRSRSFLSWLFNRREL